MKFVACALTSALLVCSGAASAAVVWDQGPTTGTSSGGWVNQTAGQNFADAVTFGSDTVVNGLNYYSAYDLSGQTGAADFQLKILADDGGIPGAYLLTQNLGYSAVTDLGDGVQELHFSFSDVVFQAGVTYWVGLSGNGFEAAQLGVYGPGDSVMAQFDGGDFVYITDTVVGDQMFQLTSSSAVPEPGSFMLLAGGLAVLAARRRRAA